MENWCTDINWIIDSVTFHRPQIPLDLLQQHDQKKIHIKPLKIADKCDKNIEYDHKLSNVKLFYLPIWSRVTSKLCAIFFAPDLLNIREFSIENIR